MWRVGRTRAVSLRGRRAARRSQVRARGRAHARTDSARSQTGEDTAPTAAVQASKTSLVNRPQCPPAKKNLPMRSITSSTSPPRRSLHPLPPPLIVPSRTDRSHHLTGSFTSQTYPILPIRLRALSDPRSSPLHSPTPTTPSMNNAFPQPSFWSDLVSSRWVVHPGTLILTRFLPNLTLTLPQPPLSNSC